ncbi:MAG: hypothetical protein U0103_02985 [Candidatus Obscuribacterales bacterium]
MSVPKYILLDANVLSETVNTNFADATRSFISENNYTVLLHMMNLVETHRAFRKYPAICKFLSNVPFVIAATTDKVTEAEIAAYPNLIQLPITFSSVESGMSSEVLAYVLNDEEHVISKLRQYDLNFRSNAERIRASIEDSAQAAAKSKDKLKSHFLLDLLVRLVTNYPACRAKLKQLIDDENLLDFSIFRSNYLQSTAIYVEFVKQKKRVKINDLGDVFQLAYVPYADLSVLDKERADMFRHIHGLGEISENYNVLNMKEFRALINVSDGITVSRNLERCQLLP